MRELLRADLPELAAAGAWARSIVARSSLLFAVLAGIGADLIASEVVRTFAFATSELMKPQDAPLPFQLRQLLGPVAGLVVARAAGGRAGTLVYAAYAVSVFALGWIRRALVCARGPGDELGFGGLLSYCTFGPLEILSDAAPFLIGLGMGVIGARWFVEAHRTGANPLLEAAGAHALSSLVFALGAQAVMVPATVSVAPVVPLVGLAIAEGALSGVVAGLRSRTPLRTAALLVLFLIGPWLYPLGISQFRMAIGSDQPEVYLFALPLLDVIVIPLAAHFARRSRRGPLRTSSGA